MGDKLKKLLIALTLLFSSFTLTMGQDVIKHSVAKGAYHKGGSLEFKAYDFTDESFTAEIKYSLKRRWYTSFIKKKYLNGKTIEVLPIDFITEQGYLDLEQSGERVFRGARLVHKGRTNLGEYYDAHIVEIFPESGKWKGKLYYHPNVKSVGWVKFELTLKTIKVISPYTLYSYIIE